MVISTYTELTSPSNILCTQEVHLHSSLINSEREVAQSVARATPGKEVLGSIPAVAARSLLVVSVSV